MIYTGLNRTGEILAVKAHGGYDVAEVYGGINYQNPIFYSRKTLTGTSPLTFKGLGQPLKDYRIFGETVQDGTPSPDYPVDAVGCGERTKNLFDKSDILSGYEIVTGQIVPNPNWGVSGYIPVEQGKYYTAKNTGQAVIEYETIGGTSVRFPGSITSGEYTPSANTRYIRINFALASLNSIMLNAGTTALPYEPYGYNIPVTVGNATASIYLGTVQTTRKIKKLVLTGSESYTYQSQYSRFVFTVQSAFADGVRLTQCYCTHYQSVHNGEDIDDIPDKSIYINSQALGTQFCIKDEGLTSIADFKSFLAAKYANGTPVTIWYILAAIETAVVNEPLHRIGDYADTIGMTQAGMMIPTVSGVNTLTIDTTVKPSAISVTGNIKPTGYGQMVDVNDVDIQDSNGTPIYIQG